MVVGAYGEFSKDLKLLLRQLAEAKVGASSTDSPIAYGEALQYLRRVVSTAAARAHTDLLLNGLRWCGLGGGEAYRRRKEGLREYDEGVAESRVAWEAHFCWGHTYGSANGDGRGNRSH